MLTITVKNKMLHHDLIAVQAITVLTMQLPSEKDTAIRGGRYQVFSVRYDTEYFTFDTVDTILFSIPILNKSEASIQDKHVDNIHIHTDR